MRYLRGVYHTGRLYGEPHPRPTVQVATAIRDPRSKYRRSTRDVASSENIALSFRFLQYAGRYNRLNLRVAEGRGRPRKESLWQASPQSPASPRSCG